MRSLCPRLMVSLVALVGAVEYHLAPARAQYLNTLESVFLGDYRALQGIAFTDTYYDDSDPGRFHTSRGQCILGDIKVEESIFYYHANGWTLLDSVNLLESLPCHVGDVSVDQNYLYVPISNDHQSPYLLLRRDKVTLDFVLSWDLTPFAQDYAGDFTAGVDYYHDDIYFIEYRETGGPNAHIAASHLDGNTLYFPYAVYEIPTRYANGIEIYGNYIYITAGNDNLLGQIHVYNLDQLSTTGVNSPIAIYTYDVSGGPYFGEFAHAEGLSFSGTDLWVSAATGYEVRRIETPGLPEYVTWTGAGSGLVSNGTLWNGFFNWDGKPTGGIDAKISFTEPGYCDISPATGSAFVKDLSIDSDSPADTRNLRLYTGAALNAANEYIGRTGYGFFRQFGGNNNVAGDIFVGFDPGSSGTYDITGGSASSAAGHVGFSNGSSGIVYLNGTSWINSGPIYVGESGEGTLWVLPGGSLLSSQGYIGFNPGSNGTVTVNGLGATWDSSAQLYVGNDGTGSVSIEAGGSASSGSLYLASGSASNGEVTIDGTDSSLMTGFLAVGAGGTGIMRIINGGLMVNNVGVSSIGGLFSPSGNGTVIVADPGSTWSASSLYIGQDGTGTLAISNGATVSSGFVDIAHESGSTGEVTVIGSGSTWNNESWLYVGKSGDGTLGISGGGVVTSTTGLIAENSGSTGNVTVDGPSSSWINQGLLDVGKSGSGTLIITNGGSVASSDAFRIGTGSASNGTAVVDGKQSMLTCSSVINVGDRGQGTLLISDGGSVSCNASLGVGILDDAIGYVTVTGKSSTADCGAYVHVGTAETGEGTLEVLDGGVLSCLAGRIGWYDLPLSHGVVRVIGVGSAWTISSDLWVGHFFVSKPSGTGELTVGPNALVDVGTSVNVYSGSSVTLDGGTIHAGSLSLYDGALLGTGTIDAPWVANAGQVSPGATTGILDILGDYLQYWNGSLTIQLGGFIAGDEYDVLSVSGYPTLGGDLLVSLINSFDPPVGSTFDIVTAAEIIGEFYVVSLPVTPSGYGFQVSYLPDRVRLTVVLESLPADITGPRAVPDGCVDAFDLGAMLGAWCSGVNDPNPPSPPCENCTPANLAVADISGPVGGPDGCVDAFDLAKLLANWCSVAGNNPCGTCFAPP